jgi:hypothetical protein
MSDIFTEYPETGRAENERLRSTIDRLQAELAEKRWRNLDLEEKLAEAYQLRDAHHTESIEVRLELEQVRAELAEAKLERDTALTDRHDTFADMQTRAEQVEYELASANARIGEMAAAAEAGGLGWMPVFTRAERAEAESDSLRATIDNMRAMNVKLTYEATGKVLAAEAREKALREALLKLVDKPLTDGTSPAALEKDDDDL